MNADERSRRDVAAAKVQQHIRRIVADAPPLTDEQADRIAAILRGACSGEVNPERGDLWVTPAEGDDLSALRYVRRGKK